MKTQSLILTLTIFLSIFSYNTVSAKIVTDGLVSYWTFDKNDISNRTLKDVWGKNDAAIHGTPKFVTGKVGDAIKFDGKNDYIDLTTLGDFGKLLGKASVEMWIKTKNQTDWMTLLNTNANHCPKWSIEFNGEKEEIGFFQREGMLFYAISLRSKDGRTCGGGTSGRTSSVFDGEWHHFVWTQNYIINVAGGSGGKIMYIDGVKKPLSTHSFNGNRDFFPFEMPVTLGAMRVDNNTQGFFEGYIDELRLYNRPLTEAQVQQNYASSDPFNVDPKAKLATLWGNLKN